MSFLMVAGSSLVSVAVLFFSAKVIGNKQMSQLNMFDYINGITIGSIAAELATGIDGDVVYPLISIIVYTLVIRIISFIGSKNIKARRFFNGRSLFLMENGKLYEKNFRLAHIDLSEFITQSHVNGYFSLNEIDSAMLEQNGQISFLPKSDNRPLSPNDINLSPPRVGTDVSIIMDGYVMEENLRQSGYDKKWLEKQLITHKIGNVRDIFLAVVNTDGVLDVYKKNDETHKNDVTQ